MKPMYFFLGWGFFAIGAAGIVLPVLPTTPFMLLALWCFSKSSQRFHQWLYHHRLFGPTLQQWNQDRVIPLAAKIMSVLMMILSFIYLVIFRELQFEFLIPIAMLMIYGIWFVLSKPSRPKK